MCDAFIVDKVILLVIFPSSPLLGVCVWEMGGGMQMTEQ